jgi:hypothetical protein
VNGHRRTTNYIHKNELLMGQPYTSSTIVMACSEVNVAGMTWGGGGDYILVMDEITTTSGDKVIRRQLSL